MNRHHLWPQSPLGSPKRRALQPSTTYCPHSPENAHVLLLLLPKALGTAYTSPRVTATSQSSASLIILHHLPIGPRHCQGPSNQALAISPAHCLPLPGRKHKPYTGTHPIKGIRACTHSRKRQQASKPKAALTHLWHPHNRTHQSLSSTR